MTEREFNWRVVLTFWGLGGWLGWFMTLGKVLEWW